MVNDMDDEEKMFPDYADIDNARKKFEDGALLDAFNIIYMHIEDVMNGCYLFSSNRKKFYGYREVMNLLFDEEIIDEEIKNKLNNFKATRVDVTHYIASSSFGRRKHQLTMKKIKEHFKMGIELYEQIYQLGFDYFTDSLADSMEEG